MKDINIQNNFNETTNFNGAVQVAGGDIINESSHSEKVKAKYLPEPKWRTPFTLTILSWVSAVIGMLSIILVGKILANAVNLFKGNVQEALDFQIQVYFAISAILVLLFVLFFKLRNITKKQIRVPLILSYAINGYGKRITIEKIHTYECPQCGGEMRYYNKLIEWVDTYYSDGKTKRETTKRSPALECKRNSEQWYRVDPAEDRSE